MNKKTQFFESNGIKMQLRVLNQMKLQQNYRNETSVTLDLLKNFKWNWIVLTERLIVRLIRWIWKLVHFGSQYVNSLTHRSIWKFCSHSCRFSITKPWLCLRIWIKKSEIWILIFRNICTHVHWIWFVASSFVFFQFIFVVVVVICVSFLFNKHSG